MTLPYDILNASVPLAERRKIPKVVETASYHRASHDSGDKPTRVRAGNTCGGSVLKTHLDIRHALEMKHVSRNIHVKYIMHVMHLPVCSLLRLRLGSVSRFAHAFIAIIAK